MKTQRTWLITGVSSGFGYEMTKQLLSKGDRVIGTVRNKKRVASLLEEFPDTFFSPILDVTDVASIGETVDNAFRNFGSIDVIVSNAGYGLFGCAEELTDEQISHIIATNLTGSIQLIKRSLPHLRKQGGGRIIQMSSYGGQVAFAGNSMYHATKFGIEGFCEAVAKEVEPFGIGLTIVEPGGARTEFRYASARVADLMPEYEASHDFLEMLDASNGLAPGDPARMAARIIESVDITPAPLRMVLGSKALSATIERLEERLADYRTQYALASSTDFPAGE